MKYLKRTKLPRTTGLNCCGCGVKMKCVQETVDHCQKTLLRESFAHGAETWQCPKCKQKIELSYHLWTNKEKE